MHSGWEKRNLEGTDKADCPARSVPSVEAQRVHWVRSWILNPSYMCESSGASKGVWIHSIYSLLPLKVKVETWHSQEPCPWRMILDWLPQLIQWLSTCFCTLCVLPFPWATRFDVMEKPLSNYRETKNGRLPLCVCERERERERGRGRERRGQKYKWGVGGGEQKQKQ